MAQSCSVCAAALSAQWVWWKSEATLLEPLNDVATFAQSRCIGPVGGPSSQASIMRELTHNQRADPQQKGRLISVTPAQ